MKFFAVPLTMALIFSLFEAQAAVKIEFKQRSPMPNFQLQSFDDAKKVVNNESLKKKATLFFFWATWCPFCKARAPELSQLAKDFPQDQFQYFLVNMDEDRQVLADFISKNPFYSKTYIDPDFKFKNLVNVGFIPFSVITDEQGVVQFIQEGDRPNEISTLKKKFAILQNRKKLN